MSWLGIESEAGTAQRRSVERLWAGAALARVIMAP
jgi:hypothetical protein